MKAGVSSENGLVIKDIPQPKPKPNEVLVKVKAASLNRADLNAAKGQGGHGSVGAVIGLDWAGDVIEVGNEVQGGFKPGDKVMCAGAGGYAEYAVADWGRVTPMGSGMNYEVAATLPVAVATMHDALISNGRLKKGESVLVQGASSGVGLMALQIAKLMGAGLVIGTSTNAGRLAKLRDFGADLAVDTSKANWHEEVKKATPGGKGVNVIIDQVAGPMMAGNMKCCAVLARIVNVGRLGGGTAEFDFNLHAAQRIDYIGVTHRTRTVDELREETRVMWKDLKDAVQSGKLHLPIDKTFPLTEAIAAQAHMKANAHFGKVLLIP